MLEFQNVSLSRKKNKILDNFSLKIPDGSIFGLVGSDERAKTALLQAVAGNNAPVKGSILLDDKSVYPYSKNFMKTGYMSRDCAFISQLTLEEYYELFLALFKVNGRYRERRMEEVLNFLELEQYAQCFLSEIPEEVKPMIALGKSILHEPKWLLLDDPLCDMGLTYRKKMLDFLGMLWEQGTSLVMNVELTPDMASFVTDIAVFEDGKMVSTGTVESVYEGALRQSPIRMRVLSGMDEALRVLRENDLVKRVTVDHEDVMLLFSGGNQEEADLLTSLISQGVKICSFIRDPMDLVQSVWR